MNSLEFVVGVGGVSVATSGAVLALVPRPRSWPVRLRWWVAGIVTAAALTFGSAILAERTDGFADGMIVGLGFFAALIVLLAVHTRADDVWAWWLGYAAVALAWVLFIAALIAFFSSLPDDF
jgi:hypothetical protein